MRLDVFLYKSGMVSSRTRGANLIELKRVTVNGVTAEKPSMDVDESDSVIIEEDYEASLGGIKLSHALKFFNLSPKGKICLDVGASNGGFTDILLKNGAKKVYALDVGECALPDKIKADERVFVKDKTNIRNVTPGDFDEIPEFVVVDVSFISLTMVIPVIKNILQKGGNCIALIKPQFECEKKDLSKKGILLDEKKRQNAIKRVSDCCLENGFKVSGVTEIPRVFVDKNKEYLISMQL